MLLCSPTNLPRTDICTSSSCNSLVVHRTAFSNIFSARPLARRSRRCFSACSATLKSEAQKQRKPEGAWQSYKAYSTLLRHAWTLGPVVLLKILIAGLRAIGQGIHAAGAEAMVVAVSNNKAEETANLSAEIVRLGWTSFACHVVVAALRRGYLESALQLCVVLIRQQDTDVLLETTQGMADIGGTEEADELKRALAGQGYQLGWFFGKIANQRVPQNRAEAVQAAKDVADTAAGAIRGAMAGVAEGFGDSVAPKPNHAGDLKGGSS